MRKKKLQEGKAIENAIAGLFVVSWWGIVNWLLIVATKVTHQNDPGDQTTEDEGCKLPARDKSVTAPIGPVRRAGFKDSGTITRHPSATLTWAATCNWCPSISSQPILFCPILISPPGRALFSLGN